MKTLAAFILFTATMLAQQESLESNRYIFAKNVFQNSYTPQQYNRFKGAIKQNCNYITYGSKVLFIPDLSEDERLLFTSGLFHADVISGGDVTLSKTKKELAGMDDMQKIMYQMTRNDSLYIGHYFDELKLLNPNPQTKRFVFWLWNKGMANPTECYFEIYNKEATEETNLRNFINGASLTFYHRGSLII